MGAAVAADDTDIRARLEAILIGRYSVIRELGRGGMATVFLARDEKHDREVAIKVLHPDLAASIGAERFEREIRLVANLQHPHILGLYDSGAASGVLFYVMPFVNGESLRDKLDREKQLPVDDALRIALEVANALGHAHSKGIVHRDIKPENILLSGDHALVADFGIARAVSEAGANKLTQTGTAVGTPLYMAPEQAAGESVGPTADLYSLGCVLFEMLTGDPPFTGKNAMAIMARHALEQVPSPRIVRSAIPEEVEEAIFRALGKVPADRPQSAAQFAELMAIPFGSTETIRIRSLTAARRTPAITQQALLDLSAYTPWWKQPRVVAPVVLLLVAAASVGAWQLSGGRRSAIDRDPNSHRLAVLYFDDHSSNRRLGALADGLTEGLIHSLASAPSLTVISRAGVERFRASPLGPDSIARALRVGYLVRGDVEPEGDRIRVGVRLDDESGVNLRRASFVRPAGNLVAMRDTLVLVASDLIKQQLKEEIHVRDERGSTTSPAAWLLMQRGEQAHKAGEAFAKNGDSAGVNRSFAIADSLLAAAEKEDPKWVDPVTLRATLAYRRSRMVGRDPTQIRKWVDIGSAHAIRALAIDAANPDALEIRGNLLYWSWLVGLEVDPERAKRLLTAAKDDLEKATTVNPRQAGAYASLSHLYYQTGSTPEVNIAAQRALEADEFLGNADVILSRLFLSSYDLGQFDKADQWCRETRRRFPAIVSAVTCQLYLLTAKTKTPDVRLAWQLADSVVALTPPPARPLQRLTTNMLVAAVLARASRTQPALADSATRLARRSEGDATIDATRDVTYHGVFVYSLLGDKADAFRLLKQYVAANPQRAQGLRDDPGWWFRDLASDPRFRKVVGTAD